MNILDGTLKIRPNMWKSELDQARRARPGRRAASLGLIRAPRRASTASSESRTDKRKSRQLLSDQIIATAHKIGWTAPALALSTTARAVN
ncbi:MAG: hypothetical protein EBZ48_10015 [Proteobacteria bacterium]|nr:hypothetical protein [Pseudomonadota bacterium]